MKIQSTGISNKSTDGSNHSSTGSDESVRNMGDPDDKFGGMKPMGVPAQSVGKNDGKEFQPSWDHSGKGISEIKGGAFRGSDAAHEDMCKHPSREYDPAMRT